MRIAKIDAEVDGMLLEWSSIGEQGMSFQEEFHSWIVGGEGQFAPALVSLVGIELMCTYAGVGPADGATGCLDRGRVFPGIGTRDEDVEPFGRNTCPADGFPIYARTRRPLGRFSEGPRMLFHFLLLVIHS